MAAFRRDREAGAACWLCRKPIDYSLGYYRRGGDLMAYAADHWLDFHDHPEYELELWNVRPSHARCNLRRQDRAGLAELGTPSRDW